MSILVAALATDAAADTSEVNAVYSPWTWAGIPTPVFLNDRPGGWSEATDATEFTSNLFAGLLFDLQRVPIMGHLGGLHDTAIERAGIVLMTRVTSCTPMAVTHLDREDLTLVWYIVKCEVTQIRRGEWVSPALVFVVAGRPFPAHWPFIPGLCHEFGIERQQGQALIVAARPRCPIPSLEDAEGEGFGHASARFLGLGRRLPWWRRIVGPNAQKERQLARCQERIDGQLIGTPGHSYQQVAVYGDRFLVITTVPYDPKFNLENWNRGWILVYEWPTARSVGFFEAERGWLFDGDPPGLLERGTQGSRVQ